MKYHVAITEEERFGRLAELRRSSIGLGIDAVLLGSTESLFYFTGLAWHSSERLLGAVVTGAEIFYIVPGFERSRVDPLPHLPGEILVWQEEESSAALVASLIGAGQKLAVDEAVPLSVFNALRNEIGIERLADAGPIIRRQRIRKSEAEIAIIKHAMNITLEVQRRASGVIRPGTSASGSLNLVAEPRRAFGPPASFVARSSRPAGRT